jgi:hypothetical protein
MKLKTRSVVLATSQEPQFLAMQSLAGGNSLAFNQEARFPILQPVR